MFLLVVVGVHHPQAEVVALQEVAEVHWMVVEGRIPIHQYDNIKRDDRRGKVGIGLVSKPFEKGESRKKYPVSWTHIEKTPTAAIALYAAYCAWA